MKSKILNFRMPVKNQIQTHSLEFALLRTLNFVKWDYRITSLRHCVIASSETLGDALMRLARFSGLTNEGVRITYHEGKDLTVKFEYVGVPRLGDRHQIECFVVILVRLCRLLTGLSLSPTEVKLAHRRTELPAEINKAFGCKVAFGSDVDEVIYPPRAISMATVNADSYLNSLLVRYCEEALSRRRVQSGAWRLRVENAIVALLPHGQAKVGEIALAARKVRATGEENFHPLIRDNYDAIHDVGHSPNRRV